MPDHIEISAQSRPLLKPDEMVNHFKVVRLVGRGGMGEVYLARDIRLGRKVALKLIKPQRVKSVESVKRFFFEARTMARLNHPHIAAIYGVGEHLGRSYLAMEYLEGHNLRERIRQETASIKGAARIGHAIAEALKEAHRNNIVHRDLKPENVIIPGDGRLRVLDFGLAWEVPEQKTKDANEDMPPGSVPEHSTGDPDGGFRRGILGSPKYMAPEQWRETRCTGAADIWALGVILYELLAGRRPYKETALTAICLKVTDHEPVPKIETLRMVPADLATLVGRCLQKNPNKRPPADEVALILEGMIYKESVRLSAQQNPFRGLLPFNERHADIFFGRDAEIAAFLERLRQEPVLPIVGPSGAGKSSFVQAGIIPRIKEQEEWIVLQMRPGINPFLTLASRLMSGESTVSSTMSASTSPPDDSLPGWETKHALTPQKPEHSPDNENQLAKQLFESPRLLSFKLRHIAETGGVKVLLFADQLEELCTLSEDEEVRARFMQAICSAADDYEDPVRVIFTLRDDFLGRVAESELVRDVLGRVTVIRSPENEALEEILIKPLELANYRYDDPDLVKDMVSEVQGESASLPLLQFTAHMLWKNRDKGNRFLLRSEYESIGRVGGALAEHADGVLEGMSTFQVQLARDILLRLVSPEKTRRILTRARTLEGLETEAEEVLRHLTKARLIMVRRAMKDGREEAELELVHESLIGKWKRLSRWINESMEELALLAEIEQAAELWEKRGRREAEIWQGDALHEAQRTLDRGSTKVPRQITVFMEAGLQRERKIHRRQRLRRITSMAVLAAIALISIFIAWEFSKKEREAIHLKDQTSQRWSEAQREGARAAFMRGDFLEARAKLRSSLEKDDSPLARALWWTLQKEPLVWKKKVSNGVWDVAFSPDGRMIAGGGMSKSVFLFDTTVRAVRVLRGHDDQVTSLSFSPDAKFLAAGTWGGQLLIWNLDQKRAKLMSSHEGGIYGTSFSPDGKLVASGGNDGTIMISDVQSGVKKMQFSARTNRVRSVSFSPDGKLLASGNNDNSIRLWEEETGAYLKEFSGHTGVVESIGFSPDGKKLVSGSQDRSVRIWDVAAGSEIKSLWGHLSTVYSVSFSPDGKKLASGSFDKSIHLWDAVSGDVLMEISGLSGTITGIGFGPDGKYLASSSDDGTIWLWDVTPGGKKVKTSVHTGIVNGVSFSPDGNIMATAGGEGNIIFWDVATGAQNKIMSGHTSSVYEVSFSPDGKVLASGQADNSVRLWDVSTGTQMKSLWGHTGDVMSANISHDGKLLASAGVDTIIRLWDMEKGARIKMLRGHTGAIRCVRFSPDDAIVASASSDNSIRLWDVATGDERWILPGHKDGVWALGFSPDGSILASGGGDQFIRLWDVETGEGRILKKLGGRIYKLQVHPDGRRIGVPCSDGTAIVLDIHDGSSVILRGHKAEVNYLAFSPDGSLAATTSDDGTVRLWETDSGRLVWRAPLLLHESLEVFTHLGWISLDPSSSARKYPETGWRRAVENNARQASESGDGNTLCIGTDDDTLELWDIPSDKRVFKSSLPYIEKVLSVPGGCVTLAKGQVRLYGRNGKYKQLHEKASAIAWSRKQILVAAQRKVLVFSRQGKRQASYPADVGVTAMLRAGDWLVLGYIEGNIEMVPTVHGLEKPTFSFEDVPSSRVETMISGPMETLIVGYANGLMKIWSLNNGTSMHHIQLHGPIVHMILRGGNLYTVSELGDYRVVDMSVFYKDYCDLLREVWQKVKIGWEAGLPATLPPPENHPCSAP